jgi:uncharacterized protein YdeI (YjbR/CyaY-like superfamily)
MPEYMREALEARGLMEAYNARPPYQRNDYIGWITRAKRPETQKKRLNQMLNELEKGDVYMKMAWTKRHTLRSRRRSDQ